MLEKSHSVMAEGTDAGILGGLAVAIWFLILDTIAGHPFQTPSLLGQVVLFGNARPDTTHLVFGAILVRPAMKMSGAMLDMVRGQMEKTSILSDLCKDVTLVGSERVSVPAGQYQTKHFRSEKYSSDSWVSQEVPFALVKSVGKKHDMALTAVGSGAKPSITEKPQEMPVMGGPSK